jgi:hypothetical protein
VTDNIARNDINGSPTFDEIMALVRYASERGLDPTNESIGPLYKSACEYRSVPDDQRCELASALVEKYGKLAKLTSPVNGRTLLDSSNIKTNLGWLFVYTFVFLVLALGNEVLNRWFGDIVQPEEGWLAAFIAVHRFAIDYFSPFAWGGVGSCVFLLKRLTDLASESTFNKSQMQGWQTRIWLGAILGAVIQHIYDPSSFTENAMRLDVKAVAFLTGVGVKVVYGAIEKTVEVLGEKLNLSAVRRGVVKGEAVRKFLGQKLSETDPAKDPDKRKVILSLIDELEKPNGS